MNFPKFCVNKENKSNDRWNERQVNCVERLNGTKLNTRLPLVTKGRKRNPVKNDRFLAKVSSACTSLATSNLTSRVYTLNTVNILDISRQENFNVLVETSFNVNRRHSLFCIKKIHRCDLLVRNEQRCSPLQKYAAYVFTQCPCLPVISTRNLRPIVSLPFSSSVANTPLIRPFFLQRFPVGI